MKTYRDLLIWQKSVNLVIELYQFTAKYPDEEKYGLTSQIRRSAMSIPSNIAEGYGRNSDGEFKRFMDIAMASLFELQTQIEISFRLKYLTKEAYDDLYENSREIERMMSSFIKSLKS